MKIGKFEVLETVKDGFLATLHKALDPEEKCEVALKTFECSDPEKVREFERAVRARALLTHANIARLVQIADEEKLVYVATEWLQGEDIGHLIGRRAALTLEDKLDFLLSICEGLAYAHDNNIIHCDISPSKLFLMKSGAGKILDFGTSDFWSAQFCLARRDRKPETHSYRAPEQAVDRRYDARTDIFSAGLVFFEFLTGTRPVALGNGQGIRIGESSSRLVDSAGLPDYLVEALQKAIAHDPAERYQSASEMLVAFRKTLDQVIRQRTELVGGVQSDCALISEFLVKLKYFHDTAWMQKRLKEAGVDSKLLTRIRSDSSAGFASDMQYLDILAFTDELEKTGNQLAAIDNSIAKLRQSILDLHSHLPEIDLGQARQLLETSGDLFSLDPETKLVIADIRAQSRIKALDQAIAAGELGSASILLEEIEETPPAQEQLIRSVAGAKAKLVDMAIREESLFKHAEAAVSRLENAIQSGSVEHFQEQLEDLKYQEKSLATQYPSSDLAMKLIERSRTVRHQGSRALVEHECRKAIKSRNVPAARELLKQLEKLFKDNPESEKALVQLQSEVAALEGRPAQKLPEVKSPQPMPQDEKQRLIVSQPSIRLDLQKKEEKAGALNAGDAHLAKERKSRLMDSLPPTRLGADIPKKEPQPSSVGSPQSSAGPQKVDRTDSPPHIPLESPTKKEEKAVVEILQTEQKQPLTTEDKKDTETGKPGETGVTGEVDIEAIRASVAKLFEENPEKCLGFLDTLESQLIEDPVIQSFQQKALEARKQRGAEIILTKPKKRSGLGLQGKGIACPVCGTLNPSDSKYCSQCYALIKDAKPVDVESDPGMKSGTASGTARVKRRLQTQPETPLTPRPKKATGHGAAKYYITALVAVIVIAVAGWLIYKYAGSGKTSTTSGETEVIGTAVIGAQTAELREGATIVGKLQNGTRLDVLGKHGVTTTLTQDPDSLLDVRTKKPADGKNLLTGSVKLRDLDQLVIDADNSITAWHSFWLALNKFPDAQTADPSQLKGYLKSVEEKLRRFGGQNPPEPLLEKLAGGYLALASRAKTPDDKKTSCMNAKDHLKGLVSKALSDGYIGVCAEPTPPTQPPSMISCDDLTKELTKIFNKAGKSDDNNKPKEALQILQPIVKSYVCKGDIEKVTAVVDRAKKRIEKLKQKIGKK
jgi:serine/threonine protein kinase